MTLLGLAPWMLGNSSCRNMRPLIDPPPEGWAARVQGQGFKDFVVFREDDGLYRGQQPSLEQFKALREILGVRTVINVRRTRTDEKVAETLGMKYISIPIPAWSLNEHQAAAFLKVVRDPSNKPLYIYCQFGGDRSNALTAIYRVAVQGWCKDEAIREMTQGGNYFHPLWGNLIRAVREIDVDRVRAMAGYDGPVEHRCPCEKCRNPC